jgi:hypothetical protein
MFTAMIKRLDAGRLLALAAAVLLAGLVSATTANAYVLSADGKFVIDMPTQPSLVQTSVTIGGSTVPLRLWTAEGAGGTWLASYFDLPIGALFVDKVALYDAFQAGAASGGRVLQRNDIEYRGMTGREFVVQIFRQNSLPEIGRMRVFLVGARLYQIGYFSLLGTDPGLAAEAFMNSFQVSI